MTMNTRIGIIRIACTWSFINVAAHIKSTSKLHGSKTDVHDLPYSTATQFLVEIINFLVYKLTSAEPVEKCTTHSTTFFTQMAAFTHGLNGLNFQYA